MLDGGEVSQWLLQNCLDPSNETTSTDGGLCVRCRVGLGGRSGASDTCREGPAIGVAGSTGSSGSSLNL